jgi:protoheme IX farnesyltransferase
MTPATEIAEIPETLLMGATAVAPIEMATGAERSTDAAMEIAAPGRLADLFEAAKPRMNFLVVITTAVGYYMAQHGSDWRLLLYTLVGTALTAAGASVLNQYVERDLDGKMDRTANRPMAAGRMSPVEGLAWGVVLAIVGVAMLALFVNPLTAALGAFTLGSYVFIYTPMKRVTTLCTVIGAVPGAIPPVMGVTAAEGHVTPAALLLFSILFLWQMPHFLAIAILYKDDYARGGYKMLPVVDRTGMVTARQIVVYSLALLPVTLMPTIMRVAGVYYFGAAVLMGLAFLGFAGICAVTRGRTQARQLFFASIIYLPCLLGAMMIDKI